MLKAVRQTCTFSKWRKLYTMVYYYKIAFSFSSNTTSVNKHSKSGKKIFGQGDKSKKIMKYHFRPCDLITLNANFLKVVPVLHPCNDIVQILLRHQKLRRIDSFAFTIENRQPMHKIIIIINKDLVWIFKCPPRKNTTIKRKQLCLHKRKLLCSNHRILYFRLKVFYLRI